MKRKICSFLLAFLLLLTLTPAALADGAQPSYITDDAGILTASETASLEKAAQHIAQRYGVGIYLVTVNDACRIDSRGTYEAAYTYYHRNSLGAGAERNGAILLLSMNDRAFAHFYYGEKERIRLQPLRPGADRGYVPRQLPRKRLVRRLFGLSFRVRGVPCARGGGTSRAPQPGTGNRHFVRCGSTHRVSRMFHSQAEDEKRVCAGAGGRICFRQAPSRTADRPLYPPHRNAPPYRTAQALRRRRRQRWPHRRRRLRPQRALLTNSYTPHSVERFV